MDQVTLKVRKRGRCDYLTTWRAMQAFTASRDAGTIDELWLLEHPPIFTLGLNGKSKHIIEHADIPLVQVDRGGQITYHGPGQLVAYLLLDINRCRLSVSGLVHRLEQAVINLLGEYGIEAHRRCDAPGVYVGEAKIAALGLRIKHGCSYHGLAFNVDMDLTPFQTINPCGYPDMPVTQLRDLRVNLSLARVSRQLEGRIADVLGYTIASNDQSAAVNPEADCSSFRVKAV